MSWKTVIRTVGWTGAIVSAVYAVNAIVMLAFGVSGNVISREVLEDGVAEGTEVAMFEDAPVLFGYMPTEGYVDMTDPSMTINLAERTQELYKPDDFALLMKHEQFHLVQKALVADAAGGFPSFENPYRTFRYLTELWHLESDLRGLMPDLFPMAKERVFAHGIETSADCYAQPSDLPVQYSGFYMEHDTVCSPEQVYIVQQMERGVWPTAFDGDAEDLPEVLTKPMSEEEREEIGYRSVVIYPSPAERIAEHVKVIEKLKKEAEKCVSGDCYRAP